MLPTMAMDTSDLAGILSDFSTKQQKQWDQDRRRKRISTLASTISHCDGELSSQTRNYLYDIDLLVSQFSEDADAIIQIVKRTAKGSLGREIQRFISDAESPVVWSILKKHIERTFLSSDEAEILRQNVEAIQQASTETLASYNRRFREAAKRAYGGTVSEDAERALVKLYLRNLKSTDIARKTSVEVESPTLEKVLKFTEALEAGLQRYDSLGRRAEEEPMDVSPLSPLQQIQDTLDAVVKDQRELKRAVLHSSSGNTLPPKWATSNVASSDVTAPRGNPRSSSCYLCRGQHLAYKCPHLGDFQKHLAGKQ